MLDSSQSNHVSQRDLMYRPNQLRGKSGLRTRIGKLVRVFIFHDWPCFLVCPGSYNHSFIDQAFFVKIAGGPRSRLLNNVFIDLDINTQRITWPIFNHLDFTLGQQPTNSCSAGCLSVSDKQMLLP